MNQNAKNVGSILLGITPIVAVIAILKTIGVNLPDPIQAGLFYYYTSGLFIGFFILFIRSCFLIENKAIDLVMWMLILVSTGIIEIWIADFMIQVTVLGFTPAAAYHVTAFNQNTGKCDKSSATKISDCPCD